MKNSDIYSKAETSLERLRTRNERAADSRRASILAQCPSVFDSVGSLAESIKSFENGKSRFSSPADRLRDALVSNGYPENYLDPEYACSGCRDTGYIRKGNVKTRCACFYVLASREIYSLPEYTLPAGMTFDRFDESLFLGYDTNIKRDRGEYMLSLKNTFMKFCAEPSGKNLYIFGKTGTGKSFFLVSMARQLLENGISSIYLSIPALLRIVQEQRASLYSSEGKPDPFLYRYIYSAEVLLIDDLGTEPVTQSRYSELLDILNQRSHKGRSTVISSNLNPLDLKKSYDERIYSRIIGGFDAIRLPGDDLRLQLKRKTNEARQTRNVQE